ncbi:MAG: hypothetical protein M3237_21265 [Actinomycetota bacterium]|nr:hypothetical protein [Actinomycetota bacterium]
MRHLRTGLTAAVAAVILAVTACSEDGDSADDPVGAPGANGPMPTEPVAADGDVTTRLPATVMDTGSPELCLGPVAESYPPQCGGPPLQGWDWAAYEGDYDQQGDVRWGLFYVTGTWDGTTFTVSSAEPVDEVVPTDTEPPPPPDEPRSTDELGRIADEVRTLGGAVGGYADDTRVLVDVPYDDGSLQAWVDEEYGDGVVVVTPALVDA